MKRIAVAFGALIAVMLGVFIYLMSVGGTMTVYKSYNDDIYENMNGENYAVDVKFDDENIVSYDGAEFYDDHYELYFSSLSKGSTKVEITTFSNNPSVDYINYDNSFVFFVGSFNQIVSYEEISRDYAFINFNGWEMVLVGFMVYFTGLAVYLFILFRRRIKAPHSFFTYKTILVCGFFIMTVIISVMALLMLILSIITYKYSSMETTLAYMQSLTTLFVFLSLPFVLILSVALTISNLSLIRHEGFRIQNLLGVILSVFLLGAILVPYYIEMTSISSYSPIEIVNIYTSILAFFESLMIATVICALIAVNKKPTYDKDYLIILGCGIKKDGTLMPLLKGRVDRAIEFYKNQLEKTGKKAVFVPSGGQGSDEVISESEAMKRYLIEQGIPEEQIMKEERSTNTFENMKFSKKLIEEKNKNAKVVFSTTKYHIFRSGIFSVQAGLDADGIGSKTKWYFWPNAFIREFIGLVVRSWKYVLLAFVIMILFSVIQLIYHSPIFGNILGI